MFPPSSASSEPFPPWNLYLEFYLLLLLSPPLPPPLPPILVLESILGERVCFSLFSYFSWERFLSSSLSSFGCWEFCCEREYFPLSFLFSSEHFLHMLPPPFLDVELTNCWESPEKIFFSPLLFCYLRIKKVWGESTFQFVPSFSHFCLFLSFSFWISTYLSCKW